MLINSKQDWLRHQILGRRLSLFDGRLFFPDCALEQVLTRDAVAEVIRESSVRPHDQTGVIDDILEGARKIFCILVCIGDVNSISLLLRCGIRDAKLHLSKEDLISTGLPTLSVEDFWQQQWLFIAPIFNSRVQKLHKFCILPFKEEVVLAEGGQGALSRVVFYRSHQDLVSDGHEDEDTVAIARKRIKRISARSEPEIDFESEREPLEFLRTLGHPHIIELLGSYYQNDDYNFFFPLAEGSLQDLFEKGQQRCTIGTKGFYSSIVGLSSAIHHIHNFTCESGGTNEKYKGYHRDLKPGNILIRQEKLIISDFGLSKFKQDAFPSSTIHQVGTDAYLPPEVCDLSPGSKFEDQTVGRGVDIWAFGCILAEIATYLLCGPDGVGEFNNKRTTWVTPNVRDNSFHADNQIKEEVKEWLKRLEVLAESDPQISRLVQFVWKTLIPERKKRPTAQDVLEEVSALDPEAAEDMKSLAWKQAKEQKQGVPQTDKYQGFSPETDVDMTLEPQQLHTPPPPPSGTLPNRIPPPQSSFMSGPPSFMSGPPSFMPGPPLPSGSSSTSEPSSFLEGPSISSEPSFSSESSSFLSEPSPLWKRNPRSH